MDPQQSPITAAQEEVSIYSHYNHCIYMHITTLVYNSYKQFRKRVLQVFSYPVLLALNHIDNKFLGFLYNME